MVDTPLSRRNMIKLAATAGAISTGFAFSGQTARAESQRSTPMQGSVTIHKLGPVTLHSYMAAEASAVVTTQIIETANELHIIDVQFLQSFAAEARAYANSLGKPVRQVILSHAHPDHLLGGAQFADLPFLTSDAVLGDVQASQGMYADRKQQFGDETALYLPQGGLQLGATQWDGVDVTIAEVKEAEAANTLTFHFPEAGLMIAQDLLYANAHAFPLGQAGNWIAALEELREKEGIQVIGAGHGLPAARGALDDAIAYLAFQEKVISASADGKDAIDALTAAYPGYGAEGLLDFVNYRY